MSWRKELKVTLESGMRYCFPLKGSDGTTTYPVLSEEGFLGEGSELGFLDHLNSLVEEQIKKAYMHGYSKGVIDAVVDMGKDEYCIDQDISRIGAERNYLNFDRENK